MNKMNLNLCYKYVLQSKHSKLCFFISLIVIILFSLYILYEPFHSQSPSFFNQKLSSINSIDCGKYGFGNLTKETNLIYDFFIFNNELDMLEIRLYELYPYVTLFLIAESSLTLSGKPKPFYLKDNWSRFRRYHNKIRRVEVNLDNLNDRKFDAWSNERKMRNEGIRLAIPNEAKYKFIFIYDFKKIFLLLGTFYYLHPISMKYRNLV